jgi:hypothetical protein
MPAELSFEALMTTWTTAPLSPGWRETVASSVAVLRDESRETNDALRAWQQLAMLFGDSGAPEYCAVVALHALASPRGDSVDPRLLATLRSHAKLALLDLGVSRAATPGEPLALAALDSAIVSSPDRIDAWLERFLAPVGTHAEGAALCLRLAAIRAGLATRPDPFDLAGVAALVL